MFLYRESEEGPRTLANTYEGPEPCPLLARRCWEPLCPRRGRTCRKSILTCCRHAQKKKTRFHRLLWSETLNRRAREATGPPEGGGGSAVSRQRWTATKSDTASICSTCRINTEGCCKFPKQTTCSQWEELKILRARRRKRTREFHLDVCL